MAPSVANSVERYFSRMNNILVGYVFKQEIVTENKHDHANQGRLLVLFNLCVLAISKVEMKEGSFGMLWYGEMQCIPKRSDGMAEWIERPSPDLVDPGFKPII